MEEQQRNTLGMVSCNGLLKCGNIIAHRVTREDPIYRMEEQQHNTLGNKLM